MDSIPSKVNESEINCTTFKIKNGRGIAKKMLDPLLGSLLDSSFDLGVHRWVHYDRPSHCFSAASALLFSNHGSAWKSV